MIREDKSYLKSVDILAMEKGFAQLDIHSLVITREEYTKEEMEENSRIATNLSREDWGKHCDEIKLETSTKVKSLIDILSEKFCIYQYDDDKMISFNSNWDLFFWCNVICSVIDGRFDLSYVRLSVNHNHTIEQKSSIVEHVLDYIKEIGYEGIDVTIQYTATYDTEKIKKFIEGYFVKTKNSLVQYSGLDGRIKEVGADSNGDKIYGFFKKGAKKKFNILCDKSLLMLAMK